MLFDCQLSMGDCYAIRIIYLCVSVRDSRRIGVFAGGSVGSPISGSDGDRS